MEEQHITEDKSWKKFVKNHLNMIILWIVAAIVAVIGAVYVYQWFVADAQATNLVPAILGQWSLAHIIMFMLHLAFWELVIIGIPIAIVAILGWLWWKQLPSEEREEYKFFSKGTKSEQGGGGFSFLFFVAFCLKVFIDGNVDIPISTWTLEYVVDSIITILFWGAIIIGIPAIIIGLLYLINQAKKKG
ncbi:MAG: hypothetical protein P8X87_06375 [Candidatus Bathyarchaeota archaeon]